jgi:arginase
MSEAPGTGIKNRGGFSYREIRYVCDLLATRDIRAIDLVEVNPINDVQNKTVHLGIELVLALLGKNWTQYHRYLADHPAM